MWIIPEGCCRPRQNQNAYIGHTSKLTNNPEKSEKVAFMDLLRRAAALTAPMRPGSQSRGRAEFKHDSGHTRLHQQILPGIIVAVVIIVSSGLIPPVSSGTTEGSPEPDPTGPGEQVPDTQEPRAQKSPTPVPGEGFPVPSLPENLPAPGPGSTPDSDGITPGIPVSLEGGESLQIRAPEQSTPAPGIPMLPTLTVSPSPLPPSGQADTRSETGLENTGDMDGGFYGERETPVTSVVSTPATMIPDGSAQEFGEPGVFPGQELSPDAEVPDFSLVPEISGNDAINTSPGVSEADPVPGLFPVTGMAPTPKIGDPPGSTVVIINQSLLQDDGSFQITFPGTYILTTDILHSSPVGLLIQASSVFFEGGGHRISSLKHQGLTGIAVVPPSGSTSIHDISLHNLSVSEETTGVSLLSLTGASMESVSISGSQTGISVSDAQDIAGCNLSVTGGTTGISAAHLKNTTLDEISLTGSTTGVRVTDSDSLQLTNSTIEGGMTGVLLSASENSSLSGIYLSGTSMYGLSLESGHDNTANGVHVSSLPGSIGIRVRGGANMTNLTDCTISGGATGIVADKSPFLLINGGNINGTSQNGVVIQGSAFPKIHNLSVNGGKSGISLINIRNGHFDGLFLRENQNGFAGQGLIGNSLNGSRLENSSGTAIFLVASSGTTISNNQVDSSGTGIQSRTSQVNVTGNTINSSGTGIFIESGPGSEIRQNLVTGGGRGIVLTGDASAGCLNNTVQGETEYGISVRNSPGLLVSQNRFMNTNNTAPAGDLSTGTRWNASAAGSEGPFQAKGGNMWLLPDGTGFSSECPDLDGDGFCDSPYLIPGGGADQLPIAGKTPTPFPSPQPTPTITIPLPTSGPVTPPVHQDADIEDFRISDRPLSLASALTGHFIPGDVIPGESCRLECIFTNTGQDAWPVDTWVEVSFEQSLEVYRLAPEAGRHNVPPKGSCRYAGDVLIPEGDGPWNLWISLYRQNSLGNPEPVSLPAVIEVGKTGSPAVQSAATPGSSQNISTVTGAPLKRQGERVKFPGQGKKPLLEKRPLLAADHHVGVLQGS